MRVTMVHFVLEFPRCNLGHRSHRRDTEFTEKYPGSKQNLGLKIFFDVYYRVIFYTNHPDADNHC